MGDYRTTKGEAQPLPPAERRRRRQRLILVGAGILLAIAAAGSLIRVPAVVVASGYVTTEEHAEVQPAAAGIVAAVNASSGDTVAAGDVLVQLNDAEQVAALEVTRSQLAKAEAQLARAEAQVEQQKRELEEGIAIALLREKNAVAKLARVEELRSRGLAAESSVEDIRLQREVTTAEREALQKKDVTIFEKELEVFRNEVKAAREQVVRAEEQVKLRQVRAPIAGQVVRHEFVVGERVQTDTLLYEIFGGEKLILKLRIDERHAVRVRPGHPYRARLSSYPGMRSPTFAGEVESLRNLIHVEGQRMYRTAYCRFDAGGLAVPPGATAEARIVTGRTPLGLYLLGLD